MTNDEREQFEALLEQLEEQDVMMKRLEDILPTLEALAEAWQAAGWFGRAIKWLSGVAVAMAALAAIIKFGMFHK
ncbi:MAG: hypothetical protein AAFY42_02905 [Pseudomonadota bacterium]